MRLINTTTLELSEFFDSDVPEYAILSHCWGTDEVSLQAFQDGKKRDGSGYAKIVDCCRLARQRDLDFAWVDTCCIDKNSSAELSEAINSMFSWYEQATVCFIFLSDFTTGQALALGECRWFSRGFTLQELLAPPEVEFYDSGLTRIGTRVTLCKVISQATKISWQYLVSHSTFRQASVAQRMCWASSRQTSRSEDIAYCLLGLFDVHMPLLYGEGAVQAFLRLQHQIIADTADESLFAWTASDRSERRRGMLALSPKEFARCEHICRSKFEMKRPRHTAKGKGLEFAVSRAWDPCWPMINSTSRMKYYDVPLACEVREPGMSVQTVSIELRPYPIGQAWFRANASELRLRKASRLAQTMELLYRGYTPIYVPESRTHEEMPPSLRRWGNRFLLRSASGLVQLCGILSGLTALGLCTRGAACQNHQIVVVWMYLALGWKLSGYTVRYLLIIASAVWLRGHPADGVAFTLIRGLVITLAFATYLEAVHFAN